MARRSRNPRRRPQEVNQPLSVPTGNQIATRRQIAGEQYAEGRRRGDNTSVAAILEQFARLALQQRLSPRRESQRNAVATRNVPDNLDRVANRNQTYSRLASELDRRHNHNNNVVLSEDTVEEFISQYSFWMNPTWDDETKKSKFESRSKWVFPIEGVWELKLNLDEKATNLLRIRLEVDWSLAIEQHVGTFRAVIIKRTVAEREKAAKGLTRPKDLDKYAPASKTFLLREIDSRIKTVVQTDFKNGEGDKINEEKDRFVIYLAFEILNDPDIKIESFGDVKVRSLCN